MNRRESLMALVTGTVVPFYNWPALAEQLPNALGDDIDSLEFCSMEDIAEFVRVVTGVKIQVPGLYFLPNLVTEKGRAIGWNISASCPKRHCKICFVNNDEKLTVKVPTC